MQNAKNTIKTAGFMISATLLAKVMGMLRDVLFANLYGTGGVAAAFLNASRMPLLFFDIAFGAAISSSFIPIFNEYLEKEQKDAATRYANTFITLIVMLTGVLCALGMLFSAPLTNLIASGLSQEFKPLATQLMVILFPTMFFSALAYSLTGILQSYGEFNVPAAISLVSNGLMVLYLLIAKDRLGIHGVAVAMLISWGFQVLVQLPSLKKKQFHYRPALDLKSEGIKKTITLAVPILISSWVQPINSAVNLYLANFLNGGQAAPALDYANKLYIIFVGVLTYGISNLMFPTISRLATRDNKEELAAVIAKTAKIVLAVILPVMVLFLLLRTPIVRFVYERGEFGPESTRLTASALLFYSLGMAGFGISEILNKAFYALKDGKTPMVIAMGGISLNIALSFFFVRSLNSGLWGVALAASVAANVIAIALIATLQKRLSFLGKKDLVNVAKLIVSALIMGILVYITANSLHFAPHFLGRLLDLVIPGGLGLFAYLALIFLLKTEESKDILEILVRKKKVN